MDSLIFVQEVIIHFKIKCKMYVLPYNSDAVLSTNALIACIPHFPYICTFSRDMWWIANICQRSFCLRAVCAHVNSYIQVYRFLNVRHQTDYWFVCLDAVAPALWTWRERKTAHIFAELSSHPRAFAIVIHKSLVHLYLASLRLIVPRRNLYTLRIY